MQTECVKCEPEQWKGIGQLSRGIRNTASLVWYKPEGVLEGDTMVVRRK
jgi:hypothetical protein